MAYYALLSNNNVVVNVITGNDENEIVNGVSNWEIYYGFKYNLKCVRTSYNKNIRKNFAGIGYTYDEERDAFIPPKPFKSWILDEETCLWSPPVEYPNEDKMYTWNENILNWELASD